MPKRGENIYKRKDGRWEGRYKQSESQKYKSVYGKSYHEVKEKMMNTRTITTVKKYEITSFSKLCSDWLEYKKTAVKESTYVKYYGIVYRYIFPYFNDEASLELTAEKLRGYILMLLKKELSDKTIREHLKILKSILIYGKVECTHLFFEIQKILNQRSKNKVEIFSEYERKKLEKYLKDNTNTLKLGIILALNTGMRIGEVCALKWSDIDLLNGIISVNKTIQRIADLDDNSETKTKVVITEPKSAAGNRVIPVSNYLDNILRNYEHISDTYILTNTEYFMEPRLFEYHYKKYISECGVSNHNFHSLRHTFATRCVEVGFDIKSLSEILGHSSVNVTMSLYVHPTLEHKRANMNKLTFDL